MTTRKKSGPLTDLNRIGRLYLHSKIGMLGLSIIVFFLLIAALAPLLGPNDPNLTVVGSPFDVPAWATVLPKYNNLSVESQPVSNLFGTQGSFSQWVMGGYNYSTSLSNGFPPGVSVNGSLLVSASLNESTAPQASDPLLPDGQVFFTMSRSFAYSGVPPPAFEATTVIQPTAFNNISAIYVRMVITDPQGDNYSLASTELPAMSQQVEIDYNFKGIWKTVTVDSHSLSLSGIEVFSGSTPPPQLVFNSAGTYRFSVEILGVPVVPAGEPSMIFRIGFVGLHLTGGAYGMLGTDNFGHDVWSQFVWGSQVSLLIGVLSGVGAVGLGAVIGVAGGYLGGLWDEIIGRITDFVLVLPFLPLLIIISTILISNASFAAAIYLYVVMIFVILSWPVITKIVRAQVLSVKERQFVEASRALGSGTGHILRRHILPNVMGLVYSQVAQNVAGFILLEAALDFLAISIHNVKTITWGLMLTHSLTFSVHHPDLDFVWWWFFPPGIAIASLSLAFVLVGYTLDSIFNPRLRAR